MTIFIKEKTAEVPLGFSNQNIPQDWEGLGLEEYGWKQFQRGEAYQKSKHKMQFEEKLTKNLNKAAKLPEELFNYAIVNHSIQVEKVLLKLESVIQYEAIFLVDKEDFLAGKLKEVYENSHRIKAKYNGDDFYISFGFMPYSEGLNMENMYQDGFILGYAPTHRISVS